MSSRKEVTLALAVCQCELCVRYLMLLCQGHQLVRNTEFSTLGKMQSSMFTGNTRAGPTQYALSPHTGTTRKEVNFLLECRPKRSLSPLYQDPSADIAEPLELKMGCMMFSAKSMYGNYIVKK